MECSNCARPGSKTLLLDVVSPKGIIKLCQKCSRDLGMPILRKPTTFQLKEAEKEQSSYRKAVIEFSKRPKIDEEKEKAETTLKEIVDKNYETMHKGEAKPRPDLVDNFHWILMRTRRMKKISQKQLAQEIVESEAAIKMAEQGILPEDDYRLVNKLESFLGVKIRKSDVPLMPIKEPARVIKFDSNSMKELTIADLKEMKEGAGEEKKEDEDDNNF